MIAGKPHVATTFERVNAYKRTLHRHGLPVDEALIHDGSDDAESFDRLFALNPPPTTILAGNNRSMMRLLQYLHTVGLQVPRDIAVVGLDDFEWADYFHPRLTVIAQPIGAIANRAISLLAACIETPDIKRQTLHIKPIFYSERHSFLGRSSPGAASRAIEVLLSQKCSAISLA
jgi:LacI family transcriptional regulator